jgi:hypothetical protein
LDTAYQDARFHPEGMESISPALTRPSCGYAGYPAQSKSTLKELNHFQRPQKADIFELPVSPQEPPFTDALPRLRLSSRC